MGKASVTHLGVVRRGCEAIRHWRSRRPQERLMLAGADLESMDLGGADLSGADLKGANLSDARLTLADLRCADLREAKLCGAELNGADLSGADLRRADLLRADLNRVELGEANLTSCKCGWNLFGEVNLSTVVGLETIRHYGPSVVSVGTLVLSSDRMPTAFLQRAGIPREIVRFLVSQRGKELGLASCFISYSSKQEQLAKQLYRDLHDRGVTCWYAPEELRIGDSVRTRLDERIGAHDKLLLILSKDSIRSQWVEQEVETALARERQEERNVLFPVRVDSAVLGVQTGWAALIKNTRYIGDFRRWRSTDEYQAALERLLRDLQPAEPPRGRRGTRRASTRPA